MSDPGTHESHSGTRPSDYVIPEAVSPVQEADAIQARLVAAIERPERRYLWVPADAVTFTPRVLPSVYGDGRALFTLATINQRPAYWVIRACSTWGSGMDAESGDGPDFAEMTDQILTDLEDAFGRGRCGYSGSSLFEPRRERRRWCKCEECSDTFRARWPAVDDDGGCSWSRIDWPAGFEVEPNPRSWRGNLLLTNVAASAAHAAQVEGDKSRETKSSNPLVAKGEG